MRRLLCHGRHKYGPPPEQQQEEEEQEVSSVGAALSTILRRLLRLVTSARVLRLPELR